MKVLVTGAPGTGKTHLVDYAIKHGDTRFFDTDKVQGLCEWREYQTGTVVGPVESVTPTGGDSWYRANGWYWKEDVLEHVMGKAEDIVVCGSSDNIFDCLKYFGFIVLLYKDHSDLVRNLMQPGRDQINGTDPDHHDRIFKWQEKLLVGTKKYNPLIFTHNNVEGLYQQIVSILGTANSVN